MLKMKVFVDISSAYQTQEQSDMLLLFFCYSYYFYFICFSILGSRVLLKKGGASIAWAEGGLDRYHESRILNAVAEGSQEIPHDHTHDLCLPFEINVDHLNGGISLWYLLCY